MQPARCSRPDTGHQLIVGVVLVSRTLNHRSDERVSLEAGYRCDAAKKLIPFRGLRVSYWLEMDIEAPLHTRSAVASLPTVWLGDERT